MTTKEELHNKSLQELLDLLPQRIIFPSNEIFNSYVLSIEKCLIYENDKFEYCYSVKYYCDTTELSGHNAWIKRKLDYNIKPNKKLDKVIIEVLEYLIDNNLFVNIPLPCVNLPLHVLNEISFVYKDK